jgi:hypothetical protein
MSKTNSAIGGASAGASIGGPWGAVAGGALGFLGGSDDNSAEMYQSMLAAAKSIPLPQLKEYYPEQYAQVVRMNPDFENTVTQGQSAMGAISTDPRLKQAQMSALSKMQGISDAGGKDAQFMADNNRVQNDINTNLKGNQDAIEQNMATRGMSGGMSEMVARNMSAQGSANRQAQSEMDLNSQAQSRALSALMNGGQMAGSMQAQDFNQQAQQAGAQDAISRFNASNRQQVLGTNTDRANNAQQWNATTAQTNANSNTAANNDSKKYNNGLLQDQFNNQMAQTGLANNATSAAATNSYNTARDQDAFIGGVASSAANAYAANKKKPGVI